MTDNKGHKVIVCDNGTGFVKVGYAGSNFPSHIFPSLVGRPIIRSQAKVGDIEIKVSGLHCDLPRTSVYCCYIGCTDDYLTAQVDGLLIVMFFRT